LNLENGGLDTWNQNSNIDLSTFEVSKITADLGIHAKSFTIHHYLAGWWFGTFFCIYWECHHPTDFHIFLEG
jgi:hypothetical protein